MRKHVSDDRVAVVINFGFFVVDVRTQRDTNDDYIFRLT